jgi:hypothetical protein
MAVVLGSSRVEPIYSLYWRCHGVRVIYFIIGDLTMIMPGIIIIILVIAATGIISR